MSKRRIHTFQRVRSAFFGFAEVLHSEEELERARKLCTKDHDRFALGNHPDGYQGLQFHYWPKGEAYSQEQYENGGKIAEWLTTGTGDFQAL